MSAPRGRIRGFVRRPTPDEVVAIGAKEHLHLTPAEAELYAAALDPILASIDRIDELTPLVTPLRHTDRYPGSVPSVEADPYHAFVRRCLVRGAADGPLVRLRVGVKDNLAVAGIPITNSSRTLSHTPTSDAVVVERLLDAGADIVGKTNLDDFSTSGTGESSWYGPARNAVDPARSAGGSSGGSGSAVRSGAVDIAIGVDEGGSARIPASFNGVVSIKATHGLVPSHGLTYMDHTIDSVCPIAATVELTARALDVMSGHDDRDPQWVRARPEPTTSAATLGDGVAGLTIGVVRQSIAEGLCEPGVLAAFHASCDALAAAGATITEVDIPLWSDAWAIEVAALVSLAWATVQTDGVGYGHLGEVDVDRVHGFGLVRRLEADSFPPFFKIWLLAGRYLNERYFSTYFAKGLNLRRTLRAQIDEALAGRDLLVTPTTPHVAPVLLDRPAGDAELLVRGTTMAGNTAPLNLSGHPALAVPSGADADGMPTSIQIIGAHFADALTLRAGAVVEAAVGVTPGGVPAHPVAALAL
ncbi:amidase family protein [Pseudofrankia sp. BMG5.36]|uniref:amidase family protein n=1 Tax=Pseudofrankia sp. BMG5.36 TaxID=1834512 RepID=UPI0008DB092C|nr:amidase family protein [Pseudofrankia sp. BMG5.36]OHV48881.1 amidase [Pseudofrankia sp. BMG5.36]